MSLDKAKARRAAQDPNRPGEECGAEAGFYQPLVSRGKCEGKGDCVQVCPYDVFEVRVMEAQDFAALPPSLRQAPQRRSRSKDGIHAAGWSLSSVRLVRRGVS